MINDENDQLQNKNKLNCFAYSSSQQHIIKLFVVMINVQNNCKTHLFCVLIIATNIPQFICFNGEYAKQLLNMVTK